MNTNKLKSQRANELSKGQLLLEMLIAITIGAVILAIGGTLIFSNLRGAEVVGERDTALRIMEDTFESVRVIAFQKWSGAEDADFEIKKGIYTLEKGSGNLHYIVQPTASHKWIDHTPSGTDRWGDSMSVTGVAGMPSNMWIVGNASEDNVWIWTGEEWIAF